MAKRPDAPRRRLLADISPLRESAAFRRLWLGSTTSAIGSALTTFAVPLQVYYLTRSPFDVGLIGVVELAPTLAFGLFGGSAADTRDRRKLVLFTTLGSAAVSAGLAAQALFGLHLVVIVYALAAAQSVLGAVGGPARRTFIPSLLPPDQVSSGLALNRLSFQVTLIAGPALGGVIAAVPALGLRGCYLADAVSFAASFYAVAGLPAMPRLAQSQPAVTLKAVAEGVRFIFGSQPIAGAFLADLSATVFGLPVALFPAINAERFGGDPRTLGLFTTAIGLGGLLSAALSGPLVGLAHQGRAMLVSVALWGAAFAGFAVLPGLWPTLAMLFVAGAADTVTVVLRGTIVQLATPEGLRGRVSAAEYVVGMSGGQLGGLEAGAVGSLVSPAASALSGGLLTVVGALVIGLALPGFWSYRLRERPARAELGEGELLPATGAGADDGH